MSWDQIFSHSWKRKPEKRATEAYPVAGARLGLVRSGFAAPGPISNLNLPTGVSGGQGPSEESCSSPSSSGLSSEVSLERSLKFHSSHFFLTFGSQRGVRVLVFFRRAPSFLSFFRRGLEFSFIL